MGKQPEHEMKAKWGHPGRSWLAEGLRLLTLNLTPTASPCLVLHGAGEHSQAALGGGWGYLLLSYRVYKTPPARPLARTAMNRQRNGQGWAAGRDKRCSPSGRVAGARFSLYRFQDGIANRPLLFSAAPDGAGRAPYAMPRCDTGLLVESDDLVPDQGQRCLCASVTTITLAGCCSGPS
ncbi:hypothetical protein BDW02DRAFT_264610 [Decorospora gaudefroyi]|uniref:Uncharacterized protein n=1 Tax=Decorospora gaudefroyi TaxID=184978 RepID=A0A6A5KIL1_9PLEO|nr:hypothetical protein BDW02DRAFT_264610 [Decorospora gaudefroyi]